MFEAKVAAILNQQLGAYVLGLDAEALKIGVWSGQIVLENLQVRTCVNRGRAGTGRRCATDRRVRAPRVPHALAMRQRCCERVRRRPAALERRPLAAFQRSVHARLCKRGVLRSGPVPNAAARFAARKLNHSRVPPVCTGLTPAPRRLRACSPRLGSCARRRSTHCGCPLP